MLGDLTIDIAKTLEGQVFQVTLPDGGVAELRLDEALAYENRQRRPTRGAPESRRAPFALYFVAAPDVQLTQGTYVFTRDGAPFGEMFIVPIGRDATACEYEAVFT
jgi:hypothetical protein